MKNATNKGSDRALRLDLIAMMRISQRAVDYAAKAYESRLIEFASHARREWPELYGLNQHILATVREIKKEERDDFRLRFSESARVISTTLLSVCHHAYEISLRAAELAERSAHQPSRDLVEMLGRVNHTMRLCAVAFVNQQAEHAETVLRDDREWQSDTVTARWRRKSLSSAISTANRLDEEIATDLQQMMNDLRTIALTSAALIWSCNKRPRLQTGHASEILIPWDRQVQDALAAV